MANTNNPDFNPARGQLHRLVSSIHPSNWPVCLSAQLWIWGMPLSLLLQPFAPEKAEDMRNWLDVNCCG